MAVIPMTVTPMAVPPMADGSGDPVIPMAGRVDGIRRGRHETATRVRYGGFGTAATRHATHTTRENTAERYPKRLRSHSNSKLNPRNDARKVEFAGPLAVRHRPRARSNSSCQRSRKKKVSTVSDEDKREGHDSLQDHGGSRRTSRTRPCATRARRR